MEQESRAITRTDWLLIGVLVALVLPLRCWLLYNTEVTARDSIGYIRYALQFERLPWHEVWKKNDQHPGYPICVYLMSLPVRAIDGGVTTPENMELSAQLVSLLGSLVLMVPMYWLGRQFFDRTVSFCGTLLFQYLPVSAQHLSDGISEPTFLVLLVSGLLFMVHAVHNRSVWSAIACGIFAGLAYLARPEGLLIVPAVGVALLLCQMGADWRLPRGRFLMCGIAVLLTSMLVGSIYVYATGRITNKLSAIEVGRSFWHWLTTVFGGQSAQAGSVPVFAATFVPYDTRTMRLAQSTAAFAKELTQGIYYAGLAPALLGIWWSFATLRRHAGFWALTIYAALQSVILIALAMSVHYVSDRHVMPLVLLASFFVVVGLRELPRRVLAWVDKNAVVGENTTTRWYRSATVWFVLCFAALIVAALPRSAARLHGMRAPNHEAGIWLREHVMPDDVVEDDHAWSAYFSGILFYEGREPRRPRDNESYCYVVTTRSREMNYFSKRVADLLQRDAKVVWPKNEDPQTARVVVRRQPRDFKTHPWPLAPKK